MIKKDRVTKKPDSKIVKTESNTRDSLFAGMATAVVVSAVPSDTADYDVADAENPAHESYTAPLVSSGSVHSDQEQVVSAVSTPYNELPELEVIAAAVTDNSNDRHPVSEQGIVLMEDVDITLPVSAAAPGDDALVSAPAHIDLSTPPSETSNTFDYLAATSSTECQENVNITESTQNSNTNCDSTLSTSNFYDDDEGPEYMASEDYNF